MPTKYKTNGMHEKQPKTPPASTIVAAGRPGVQNPGEVTTERKLQTSEARSWFSSVALSNVHSAAKPRLIQRAYSTLSFGGSDSGTVVAGREAAESETSKTASVQNVSERTPDRISLDRRGLTAAPTFGPREEANVRLLSLQHNAITRLDGLPTLPRLVFLDLYDNQLERLVGIGVLPNLRVLLLGKNRIQYLEGFQDLLRLEVLDLHGNRLTKLGRGLEALSELKVLNVAGNQLRGVTNHELQGLVRLQELNLRRNQLQQIDALSQVVSLKKLFLSNNNIQSMVELMNVSSSCGLLELSIDGNSVSELPECAPTLVTTFPHLRFLNGTEVTPQLRAAYVLRSSEVRTRQPQNRSDLGLTRLPRILVPPPLSDDPESCCSSSSSSCAVSCALRCDSMLSNSASSSVEPNIDSCASSPRSDKEETVEVQEQHLLYFTMNVKDDNEEECNIRPFTGHRKQISVPSRAAKSAVTKSRTRSYYQKEKIAVLIPQTLTMLNNEQKICNRQKSSNHIGKAKDTSGELSVEIEGRCLNVQGQAAIKYLEKSWNPVKSAEVHTVRFNYIHFNIIAMHFAKLRQRFPAIESFIFRESSLHCLAQLNALAELQGISALTIEEDGNPIFYKDWKTYAVYRLMHWGLEKVNGECVSEEMTRAAAAEFSGLSEVVLMSLPGSLLLPLLGRLTLEAGHPGPPPSPRAAKEWLYVADPTLRYVVCKEALQWKRGVTPQEELAWRQRGRVYLTPVLETGCYAAEKLHLLKLEWQDILTDLIQEALVDFFYLDIYVKKCIAQIKI